MVLLSFFLNTATCNIFFPTKVLVSTLVTIILPLFVKTMMSSISLQSQTYSSRRIPVPTKPSILLTKSFVFLITTLVTSTSSNILISVLSFAFSYGIAHLTGSVIVKNAVLLAYVIHWIAYIPAYLFQTEKTKISSSN